MRNRGSDLDGCAYLRTFDSNRRKLVKYFDDRIVPYLVVVTLVAAFLYAAFLYSEVPKAAEQRERSADAATNHEPRT